MAHCNFLTEVKTRKIRGVDNKDAKKRSILKITMDGFDTYNYQHSILFIHNLNLIKRIEKMQKNIRLIRLEQVMKF